MLSPCLLGEAVPGLAVWPARRASAASSKTSALSSRVHVFQGCQKRKGFQPHSQTMEFCWSWLLNRVALWAVRCGDCKVGMQRFLLCQAWDWMPG